MTSSPDREATRRVFVVLGSLALQSATWHHDWPRGFAPSLLSQFWDIRASVITKAVQRAAETESESADPNCDSSVLHDQCVRARGHEIAALLTHPMGRPNGYDPKCKATMRPVNNSVT